MWSIIFAIVWQWTPFMMHDLLAAACRSRPMDVVEAARIDSGASPWQIFTNMTLPHLRQYIDRRPLGTIYGPELRPRVHHHQWWSGHGEPAVLHLRDLIHRTGLRPASAAGVVVVI